MERSEVYQLIDSERAYQQALGMSDKHKPTEWLESIRYYLENARGADHIEDVTAEIRKVAALCVAALEQYGCPPREGYEAPQAQPAQEVSSVALYTDADVINAIRKAARELIVYDTDLADYVLSSVNAVVLQMRDAYEDKLEAAAPHEQPALKGSE